MKEILTVIEHRLQTDGVANVVIAGMTCSGKTTLANEIKEEFSDIYTVSILHQDDYFRNLERIPKSEIGYHMDSIEAFCVEEFVHDSFTLFAGRPVFTPIYDVSRNRRVEGRGHVVYSGNINVVEGLHAIGLLHDRQLEEEEAMHLENVFLEVNLEVCLKRRIERDTTKYHVPEWRIRQAWKECILPLSEQYIFPQKKHASLIMNEKGGEKS